MFKEFAADALNAKQKSNAEHAKQKPEASKELIEISKLAPEAVLQKFSVSLEGLPHKEVKLRLAQFGFNKIVHEKKKNFFERIFDAFKDPLVLLLILLAIISFFTGDLKAVILILFLVFLSVFLRLFQELKADKSAEKLSAMVTTTATVTRHGKKQEISLRLIVPGDIVNLSAGDLVPADIRLISSKDLSINQAMLTGEAIPFAKHAFEEDISNPLESVNICFMGTNVESGVGVGIVIATGSKTYFGGIAESIVNAQPMTSFDKGIKSFAWLMIRIICVLAPLIFFINWVTKGDILSAFLFALSVVVGLTPEMLPMIVNVNLAKGASMMSGKKVIVKRLDAIQNFGAMDILCTDKTGTLTQGKIILEKHIDVLGNEGNTEVVKYAYLNSFYQTGLKNILDHAILAHVHVHKSLEVDKNYKKIDEIPFDFERKRMSVILQGPEKNPLLICKGAVEEILGACIKAEAGKKIFNLDKSHRENVKQMVEQLNKDGFRVIAVAFKPAKPNQKNFEPSDEKELVLSGFIAFLDPPKDSSAKAIKSLENHGIIIKVLTGDNELIAENVCRQVGISTETILLGIQIEKMSDSQLEGIVDSVSIFAKLSPHHKERIIAALQKNNHVVGFLGDGINDAPAMRAADVSISVNTAVDIAKESSSIILLERSLLVLNDGVVEGRKVFGNIVKYIKMTASSSFGNMFSVIGASIFLPFLPMLPLQILILNLLYDTSQVAIPTDEVDKEWLVKPRRWNIKQIKNFILSIGPISSIFDFATFAIMLFVFNAWANPELFHTGWFVESLFTQTLIIHVIRTNKIPFVQSRASITLTLLTTIIVAIGILLPFSPIAKDLGFVPLPPLYWLLLAFTVIIYFVVTQKVKNWFIKKFGEE